MKYWDKNGNMIDVKKLYTACPQCKHTMIDYTNNEFGFEVASQHARCEGCGHDWVDTYIATGSEEE